MPPINLHNYHLLGVVSKLHSKYTQNRTTRKDRVVQKPADFMKNR